MSQAAALIGQVRSGANRNLQVMAASGLLPIAPEDLIPLQVDLAMGGDEDIAQRASEALRGLSPGKVASYIQEGAPVPVLRFFALEAPHPQVITAVLRRRDVPHNLLVAVAPNLNEEMQEQLLLRQDAILDEPRILDALERSPQLSQFARRRIQEYRDHLLPKQKPAPAPKPKEPVEEATDEEVQEAIAVAAATEGPGAGEKEESTGLTDVQIRTLPMPVRMRLSRQAPTRGLRAILVRDTNSLVAVSCIRNSHFSDQEIETVASNRSIHEDVFDEVCRNRHWLSKYTIAVALVRNPKAPVAQTVKLVPRLSVRDLRTLSRDRNVSDVIRQTATRLYRIKVK